MKKILLIAALCLSIIRTNAQSPSATINGVPGPFIFTGSGVVQTGQTFTFSGGGGTGTVTSVVIAGTANQVTVSGTCTITTSGTCTLSLPNAVNLGTDNSAAGTLQLSNGSAAAHSVIGSSATTSNTIDLFATAPTNLDLFYCATSGTTCTLTDAGFAYNAYPAADLTGTVNCARLPALTGYVTTTAGSCATSLGSTSIVGGIIGGSFSGIAAGHASSWFTNASSSGQQFFPLFPFSFYLGNFSINVSTAFSANETYQISSLPLPMTSATFVPAYPPLVTLGPSTATGTMAAPSSASPIPNPAWYGFEPFYAARTFAGAAAGVANVYSAELLGTTIQPLGYNGGAAGTTVALSTTSYAQFSGASALQSTEGEAGVVIPWANGGTIGSLVGFTAGAQSGTGSLVGTLRVNASSPVSGPTFTVAASAVAGAYPDLTDTATVTQGQWVDVQLANNASATSAAVYGVLASLTPAAPATGLLVFTVGAVAVNNDFYAPYAFVRSATELQTRGPMPRAGTITNLYCIYTNPPTVSATFTLYKNGSSTSLQVSIPTTGSGVQIQSDTSHSVSVVQGDGVDVLYTQASGTAATVGSCSAELD